MNVEKEESLSISVWRLPLSLWAAIGVIGLMLVGIFYSGLDNMVGQWNKSDEYGYGYLIPVLTLFFIWQKKEQLERIPFNGSWAGVLIMLLGVCLSIVGELSALYIIVQYSFLITLYGVILSIIGWQAFKTILVPLLLLFFMIPLPAFIYQGLSAQLQLISSELGVAVIRLFGISVYLEGNVIDLGNYKLQVVEACSGLRYLFPLMSLAFVAAYIFKAPFWMRATIFLSSIPITIFMNSLRIGIIGILVENWGPSQAEGFLHYFEGWVIFMACMAILLLEMWLLTKIGGKGETLQDLFAIDFPEPTPSDVDARARKMPLTFIVSGLLLAMTVVGSASLVKREEIIPQRTSFAEFPMQVGDWKGVGAQLEPIVLDTLKLDDYIIADYGNHSGDVVNFYVAYYASQRKGASVHSPRSCIPGGGWKINELSQHEVEGVSASGVPLVINRVEITKGDDRQIVYYWFQGRSRVITNEYMVKWYLFWDSLTRSRTDGALVRLTANLSAKDDPAEADRQLTSFARDVSGLLSDYIPD